jgi:prepilin-type processing-associated H-X9-DG protein
MRQGLRLIDWLVVIAIAGLTVGLFMPAINTGCGRGGQCQNNARQIGLAFLMYANRHGVFPPSAVEGIGSGSGYSCFLMVLPEFDEQDLYNAYNFSLENWSGVTGETGTSNAAISSTRLSILRCPSNPNIDDMLSSQVRRLDGSSYPGGELFARSHYAVNWGGGRQGWGTDFERTQGKYRGVMMTVGNRAGSGEAGRCIGEKDITDGASQTILLCEKKDSQGWNVGGWAGSEFDVGISPCYQGTDSWGEKVYPGSYHQGLVNVTFADGSVRALSGTINRKLWYALITRDGGEPISPRDLEW